MDWLKIDWLALFLSLIFPAVLAYWQRHLSAQVQALNERQKHENQRKLTDFNLYATKKHERYIELYEKISRAHYQVLWCVNPVREMPSFADHNKEDMLEFLNKYNITSEAKEKLINAWDGSRNEGVRKIHEMILSYEKMEARAMVGDAVEAYYKTQLYLSQELSKDIDCYLDSLNYLANLCYYENQVRSQGFINDQINEEKFKKSIEVGFPRIVKNMRYALRNDSLED